MGTHEIREKTAAKAEGETKVNPKSIKRRDFYPKSQSVGSSSQNDVKLRQASSGELPARIYGESHGQHGGELDST